MIVYSKKCSDKTVKPVTMESVEYKRDRSMAGGMLHSKLQAKIIGKEARNNTCDCRCLYAIT